jgi:hypothetical protein
MTANRENAIGLLDLEKNTAARCDQRAGDAANGTISS